MLVNNTFPLITGLSSAMPMPKPRMESPLSSSIGQMATSLLFHILPYWGCSTLLITICFQVYVIFSGLILRFTAFSQWPRTMTSSSPSESGHIVWNPPTLIPTSLPQSWCSSWICGWSLGARQIRCLTLICMGLLIWWSWWTSYWSSWRRRKKGCLTKLNHLIGLANQFGWF